MSEETRVLWLTENYPPRRGGMAQACDRIVSSLRSNNINTETCFCNYPVDRFILHGAFTADDLEALKGELKAYENIIIVFHSGAPIKRTGGPRLEAFCKPEQFKALASLAADHTLFGVWAGNPYKLAEFPEYKDFQCFIVSYSDTAFNNKAAVHALFKGTARGVLPVTIK